MEKGHIAQGISNHDSGHQETAHHDAGHVVQHVTHANHIQTHVPTITVHHYHHHHTSHLHNFQEQIYNKYDDFDGSYNHLYDSPSIHHDNQLGYDTHDNGIIGKHVSIGHASSLLSGSLGGNIGNLLSGHLGGQVGK